MQRLFCSILAALALGPSLARAAVLSFTGSLSIQVAGVFPVPGIQLPPIVVPGSGMANAAAESAHLQTLTVPASAFSAAQVVLAITDPMANPVRGIQATVHNAEGRFSGATLGGVMPLAGVTKVCLFKACSAATANISIPFSEVVGAGGTIHVQPPTTTRGTTVVGAPWTAGVAAVGTITQMGFAHGPGSGTSSTAQASGAARLVSPIFVSTSIAVYATAPSFALLDLHFAPEPSSLLLSGGGAAALLALGTARYRRRRATASAASAGQAPPGSGQGSWPPLAP